MSPQVYPQSKSEVPTKVPKILNFRAKSPRHIFVGTLGSLKGYSGVTLWVLCDHFEDNLGSLGIYF